MDLKIKRKYHPCHSYYNRVYFEIDEKEFEISISYIPKFKGNYYIEDKFYKQLEVYINEHYNCDFEDFKKFFLYKLYKYSRGRNLNKVDFIDLSDVKKVR